MLRVSAGSPQMNLPAEGRKSSHICTCGDAAVRFESRTYPISTYGRFERACVLVPFSQSVNAKHHGTQRIRGQKDHLLGLSWPFARRSEAAPRSAACPR